MIGQGWVDIVARWLHILSVVAWIGGNIFLLVAFRPAVGRPSRDARQVLEVALLRFRELVTAATIIVLLSGFALLWVRVSFVGWAGLSRTYHTVFGIKVVLALALIAVAHASMARVRRWAAEGRPGDPPLLLPRVALATAVLVIFLGVLLHWL